MHRERSRTLLLCTMVMLLLAGCAADRSAADEWVRVNPGGGGWFMCVDAGPTGVIIVCSDLSGAYRSLDRGRSWDVIGSYRGLEYTHVNAVGFDPTDGSILYLGTNEGLYRSEDTGETFQKVVSSGYWGDIAISAADPDVGYAARQGGQVYKTTDRGHTWSKVSEDEDLAGRLCLIRLLLHPTDPDVVYLLSGEHRFEVGLKALYRSTDGGAHWDQVGGGLGDIYDMLLDPSDPRTLYVSVEGRGVYKSTDDGESWTHQTDAWGRIFAKSSSVLRIVNASGYVWETTDGGGSWYEKSLEGDWDPGWEPGWHYSNAEGTSIGGDMSDPDAYYWVNAQFVYGSFDGGSTFGPLYTRKVGDGWQSTGVDNTEVFDLEISEADHHIIYIALWDMGLWRSLDYGETWQSCNQGDYGWEGGRGGDSRTVLTDPARPEVVWAANGWRGNREYLLRSDDYGALGSWSDVGNGLPSPDSAPEIWGLSLDRTSPTDNRTLFVTASGKVYRSTDDGYNWSKVFSGGRCRMTAVDRFDGDLVYAGGDGGLWRSTDGGDTWSQVGPSEMRGVYDVKVDPSNEGWVYVTCYGRERGLYRSKDGGDSWEKLWTSSTARGVAIDPVDPDVIYATSSLNDCCGAGPKGSAGVVRSTDGGETWQQVNEGLPWPFAWPIEVDPTDHTYVFVGSPGTGYYRRKF